MACHGSHNCKSELVGGYTFLCTSNESFKPISAMAAVTKNLSFGITASTSFEPPFLLAKRFSTLDHLTQGRFAWNIVTSWKKAAFKAIGIDAPIEHDERYLVAEEYLQVLYKQVSI